MKCNLNYLFYGIYGNVKKGAGVIKTPKSDTEDKVTKIGPAKRAGYPAHRRLRCESHSRREKSP